ncbi:MAG TPA: hypothetical protein VF538_13945 [Pyrinomonadaceae bacterium]
MKRARAEKLEDEQSAREGWRSMWFLKRFLPFALSLLAGVAAFSLAHHERRRTPETSAPRMMTVAHEAQAGPREMPELHVLSVMKMSEVREFELRGGGYVGARVLSPPGSQYTAAEAKDYRRGVLQLEFLFGADGTISEVTPPPKRHDCGLCLSGRNVVLIDPRDVRWGGQLRAAEEAVGRIEFVPGALGGRPVGTHGIAECVFRLD